MNSFPLTKGEKMVVGFLIAFLVFVVLCFLKPLYLKYLIWYWNGGAIKALYFADVSSFAELYDLPEKVFIDETLTVKAGVCMVTDLLEEGTFAREKILFQYVSAFPDNEISLDSENHYSLRKMFFYQKHGKIFPRRGFHLTHLPFVFFRAVTNFNLFCHKKLHLPVNAFLIIPERMSILDISLVKGLAANDERMTVSFGSQEDLAGFAKTLGCKVIPVKVLT